jgi:predicted acylesterase/phospholipase RssA
VDPDGPELRIGLVLYGGVSLAVYIYGVVVEMQRLLVAAAELERGGEVGKMSAYACALDAAGISKVSVDLLSGTSAGGINGILLAKALARGADVYAAKDIWIDGGDIAALMQPEDAESPHSLLRSEYFEAKLEEGMKRLDEAAADAPAAPAVLDLFVSSTHLRGGPRQFVDALGSEISTRQHRYVFQLKVRSERKVAGEDALGYEADDFTSGDNPRLTKLARATSAFPVAFAPVEIEGSDRLLPEGEGGGWFADGGILNNKPFTEAVETIVNRSSDRPVRRWLFSVDPDPKLEAAEDGAGLEPGFDQIAVSAIASIPRYQSIARDLLALEAHNQKVEAATAAILEGEFEIVRADTGGGADPLGAGPAAAYAALRRQARNLELADRLNDAVRIPEGGELDSGGVHRAFVEAAEALPFEADADLAFQRRRAYYLIKLVSMATGPAPEALRPIRVLLWAEYERISAVLWETLSDPALRLDGAEQAASAASLGRERIAAALDRHRVTVAEVSERLEAALPGFEVELEAPNGDTTRVDLGEVARDFERRDAVFLSADVYGGLRQRDRVAHAQIRPAAAVNTGVPPQGRLAGAALGHFGGFLSRGWRRNDLMWGRLDGAEVLMKAILKGAGEGAGAGLTDAVQLEVVQSEMPDWGAGPDDWRPKLAAYAAGDRSGGDLTAEGLTATGLAAASTMRAMLLSEAEQDRAGSILDRARAFALEAMGDALNLALRVSEVPIFGSRAKGKLRGRVEKWLRDLGVRG